MNTPARTSVATLEQPPAFVMFCNGALTKLVVLIAFVSSWAYLLAPAVISALPNDDFNPSALWLFYPLPASLVLLWGHKRICWERVGSRFWKVFWPIATIHYVALAVAFVFIGGLSGEKVSPTDPPQPSHGLGYFILAVVLCTVPAILSLPPLVFSIQRSLKGRP